MQLQQLGASERQSGAAGRGRAAQPVPDHGLRRRPCRRPASAPTSSIPTPTRMRQARRARSAARCVWPRRRRHRLGRAGVGAPGGRDAGAPLDLSVACARPPAPVRGAAAGVPPPRNANPTGVNLATLPPSARPKDEYDLAYGYVLRKDYALADASLPRLPQEASRRAPGAGRAISGWARACSSTSTTRTPPNAFSWSRPNTSSRQGAGLAAAARPVARRASHRRKSPAPRSAKSAANIRKASASVKRGVAQEQKRARC